MLPRTWPRWFIKRVLKKEVKLFKSKKRSQPGRRQNQLDQSRTFSRNRTITGTTLDEVNSASEHNASLKSDRVKAHDLSNIRRKVTRALIITLLGVAFIAWAISQFTATPVVKLDNSSEYTADITDKRKYESAIDDYLKANPLARFRILLNTNDLKSYLYSKIPELDSIEQKGRDGLGKTEFVLSMRKPVASWVIGDSKYYVDGNGESFKINYFKEPAVQIVDETGVSSQTGGVLASNRMLSFVGRVVEIANSKGHKVSKVILPPDTTRQINLELKGVSYYVKLSIDRPVGAQVEDMSRTIKHLKSRGTKPAYVDVRVGGRAFYR